MATREAKLRRIDDFRRTLPHVSMTALHKIIAKLEREGIPELHGPKQMREASAAILDAPTPYGPIRQHAVLAQTTGAPYELEVAHPLAMLWTVARTPGGFSSFLQQRFMDCPSDRNNRWSLIIYTDEIVPGNPLGHENKRKSWVFYYSFLEFGMHALCNEDAWFLEAATRSSSVKLVSAGLSLLGRRPFHIHAIRIAHSAYTTSTLLPHFSIKNKR